MGTRYQKYSYDGPVIYFDRAVADHWKGETIAPSIEKARSNLTYQVKKQMNLVASTNIKLPGTIKLVINQEVKNNGRVSI